LKNPSELAIAIETGAATTALVYPADGPGIGATLILGHGAGAGQRSRFMVDTSRALSALGLDIVTFNFLYTEQKRRIPDRRLGIRGLVLLGYPLHPPGRPQQRRDAHLPAIEHPMLFVQGGKDAFGTPAELEPVLATLPRRATLHVVIGGDHSFKVTRSDAARQTALIDDVYRTIAEWVTAQD
jgi:predicted alpha/beta-hydrolase family hydrolase